MKACERRPSGVTEVGSGEASTAHGGSDLTAGVGGAFWIGRADVDLLQLDDFVARCSAESLARRFHGIERDPVSQLARTIPRGGSTGCSLAAAACDGGHVVGIASIHLGEPPARQASGRAERPVEDWGDWAGVPFRSVERTAEVAVMVCDAYQRRGIATALVDWLLDNSRPSPTRVEAYLQSWNSPAVLWVQAYSQSRGMYLRSAVVGPGESCASLVKPIARRSEQRPLRLDGACGSRCGSGSTHAPRC